MSYRDTRPVGGIYRVGQQLTSSGMLTTYTAYNRNTNDVVGLHIIDLQAPEQLQAIQPGLQMLDKRRHVQSSHVLRIHDWGIDQHRIYIATDPPRGVTLQHVFDNENVDIVRAIDLIRQIAIGLNMLHEQGIAGLDLRPQLITVDTIGVADRVQIDDIGLRPILHALGYVGQQNNDMGYLDPRYIPPEYMSNRPVGIWSDIYQAGLLLFTAVTGRLPFVGRTSAETGVLQSTAPVPQMSSYQHNTPLSLQRLVEQTMQKDHNRRFMSMQALITALNTVELPKSREELREMIANTPSIDLTREMLPVRDDIALHATLISQPLAQIAQDASVPNLPTGDGIYAYLVYEKGNEGPQLFPVTQKNAIIGRIDPKRGVKPDLDLSRQDTTMTVSRQHARIRFEGTFFYIEDLKSRNKTRLGELVLTPLQPELLQHGDTIQFGSVRLSFKIPGMTDPPRLKPQPRPQRTTE